MPKILAISAAVAGSIEPALLSPSVSRITTFEIASLSFKRLTEDARPSPMAVPSSSMPHFMSLIILRSMLWSVVKGTCVNVSLAKTTNPILSSGRPFTKSEPTSLAASKRSGFKSMASILLEISIVKMMSMPSTLIFRLVELLCGRANAMINNAKAHISRAKSR